MRRFATSLKSSDSVVSHTPVISSVVSESKTEKRLLVSSSTFCEPLLALILEINTEARVLCAVDEGRVASYSTFLTQTSTFS